MGFKITRDFLATEADEMDAVGTEVTEMPLYGMERVMGIDPELPTADSKVLFNLYDDDGELYYEGLLDDDDACENQAAALRWGEAMAGCTTIKVSRAGKLEQEIA